MAKSRRVRKLAVLVWVAELPISFFVAIFLHFILQVLLFLSVIPYSGADYYRFWDLGAREPEHLIWTLMICYVLAGYFLLVEAYTDLRFALRRHSYMAWIYGLALALICGGLSVLRGNFILASYANDPFGQSYQVQYIPTYIDIGYDVTPDTMDQAAYCDVKFIVSIWDREFLYGALSPWYPGEFDERNVRLRFPDFFDVEVLLDKNGNIRVDRPYFEGPGSQRYFKWLLRQLDRQARKQGCEILKDVPFPPWSPRVPNRLHNDFLVETNNGRWPD